MGHPSISPLELFQHHTPSRHCDEAHSCPAFLRCSATQPTLGCTWHSVRCRSHLLLFFLPEPVAFRRVYGLEAYSRTSRESNHHRQSVSAVKNDALPTEPRGHPKTISFRRPGSVETTYDFTLIEYKLHIDETPWTIYSTLVNALETEFFEEF